MSDNHSRQAFLGKQFEAALNHCVIGVVGLCGGGSHIVQQLAHVGFRYWLLSDPDVVEQSNLTRLVGATVGDADTGASKVEVVSRVIRGLQPEAGIEAYPVRWQERTDAFRRCHIIVGCVDSFAARDELEAFARRYLIAYFDLGMDVAKGADAQAVMGGQVAMSLPGMPCLRCLGILNEKNLAEEALAYGAVGGRPQVVWANGVLASIAVGRIVDMLSGWNGLMSPEQICWGFDGNRLTVTPHWRQRALAHTDCKHYSLADIGPAHFLVATS